jgi:hypothetical protein
MKSIVLTWGQCRWPQCYWLEVNELNATDLKSIKSIPLNIDLRSMKAMLVTIQLILEDWLFCLFYSYISLHYYCIALSIMYFPVDILCISTQNDNMCLICALVHLSSRSEFKWLWKSSVVYRAWETHLKRCQALFWFELGGAGCTFLGSKWFIPSSVRTSGLNHPCIYTCGQRFDT